MCTPGLWWVRVAHLFSFLCCVLFCFVCLHPVSCVHLVYGGVRVSHLFSFLCCVVLCFILFVFILCHVYHWFMVGFVLLIFLVFCVV